MNKTATRVVRPRKPRKSRAKAGPLKKHWVPRCPLCGWRIGPSAILRYLHDAQANGIPIFEEVERAGRRGHRSTGNLRRLDARTIKTPWGQSIVGLLEWLLARFAPEKLAKTKALVPKPASRAHRDKERGSAEARGTATRPPRRRKKQGRARLVDRGEQRSHWADAHELDHEEQTALTDGGEHEGGW